MITEDSLWSNFMKSKYHKEIENSSNKYAKASVVWRRIRSVREEAIQYMEITDQNYKWTLSPDGKFSSKHTWQEIRTIGRQPISFKYTWSKILPRRISIFMWKLLHNILPLDKNIRRMGIQMASKCRCCAKNDSKDLAHLFFTGETAQDTWLHFSSRIGINFIWSNFSSFLKSWWMRAKIGHEDAVIFHVLPAIICWNLWKCRNRTVFDDIKMDIVEIVGKIKWEIQDLNRSGKFGTNSEDFEKKFHEIFDV